MSRLGDWRAAERDTAAAEVAASSEPNRPRTTVRQGQAEHAGHMTIRRLPGLLLAGDRPHPDGPRP